MTYRLGIDVGPTHTTWATIADGPKHRPATGHVENIVGLRADGGVVAGEAVHTSADVLHTATEFMGRMGQSEPLMVGSTPFGAESLVGHVLATVLAAARDLHGGEPSAVVLVHDDGLDQYRTELLGEAARLAGVPTTAISVASRSEALAAGGGAVGAAALGWQRTPDPEVPGSNTAATVAGGAAAGGAVGGALAAALGGGSGVAEALGSAAGPMGTPLSAAAAPGTPLGAAPGAPLSAPGAAPGAPLSAPGAAPGTPLTPGGAAPGTPLTPPAGAAPGSPLPTGGAAPGTPITPGGAAPGTPLTPPSGAAPGSPLSPPSGSAPSGGTPSGGSPSGGTPGGSTPGGSGTPTGGEPAPSGSGTPGEPTGAPEPGGTEAGTTGESTPSDPGTSDPGTSDPGTPDGGSGTGRPPRLDPTRPAIDLVAPVVKSPFPWVKVAAIAALLGVTGGTLAWFLTRGDDGSVAPASTPAVTTVAETVATTAEPGTTAATTTVAPAVTGVALTTSTTVAPTLPPTTPAPTLPAPTTTVRAPIKTVPATTTTVQKPIPVPTTIGTLPPLVTFPVILPPLLLNFGPTISNLIVSPASVSSCGQNVNVQVTLTDTDGVSSANATISYVVAGVTRTANIKLSPQKSNTWVGSLLINLGDVVNQPASVKITAVDTKGKSANQTFANRFTVLPCIIG